MVIKNRNEQHKTISPLTHVETRRGLFCSRWVSFLFKVFHCLQCSSIVYFVRIFDSI